MTIAISVMAAAVVKKQKRKQKKTKNKKQLKNSKISSYFHKSTEDFIRIII